MKSIFRKRSSSAWRLGVSMPLIPLAGLLLRDAAQLPEAASLSPPPLKAPRLSAPSPRETATSASLRAASDAWAAWWPTTISADTAGDPEAFTRLAGSSLLWRTYLAEQQEAALALAGNLKDDWVQEWRAHLSRSGTTPEQTAARSALDGCQHGRSHPHDAAVVVLPFTNECWQTFGSVLVVDTATRSATRYVDRLAGYLEGMWEPDHH